MIYLEVHKDPTTHPFRVTTTDRAPVYCRHWLILTTTSGIEG